MKRHWYDHLWVVSLTYLILGFFNILFAWLGLFCFFIPLIISAVKGTKGYCNRYCGRGQLLGLLGGRFGLSRRKDIPKWMKSKGFRYGFLVFFFAMFFVMLWNTYLVFAEAQDLKQVVTLLWTFKLPWQWGYHGTFLHPGRRQRFLPLLLFPQKSVQKLPLPLVQVRAGKKIRAAFQGAADGLFPPPLINFLVMAG